MGGWGFKTRVKKKCWRKMAKRIMKKRGRNGRESKSEKEKRGEWKNEKKMGSGHNIPATEEISSGRD